MNHEEYIEIGLSGDSPLKVIMKGSVETGADGKVGVVSIVFATMDKDVAKEKLNKLLTTEENSTDYYMVYSVPLDTDLEKLSHYPSIAISSKDLI